MKKPIPVTQADKIIQDSAQFLGAEKVALEDATMRVIAEDIIAESDNPPFDRVMMDGIVCRSTSTFPLKIVGVVAAGDKTKTLPEGDVCFESMTGCSMPHGADCIIPVEDIHKENGVVTLNPGVELQPGRFLHKKGGDIKQGTVVLKKGRLITAPVAASLAANGIAEVLVGRRPKVRIIATGNELVDVTSGLEDGQIRRSNDYMIESFVKRFGAVDIKRSVVEDDQEATEKAIQGALEECDILVLSGGVSKGNFDFVPIALEKSGIEELFHRVLQRPGAPFYFGASRTSKKVVFALPGNPLASLACAVRYLGPFLQRVQGVRDVEAPLCQLSEIIEPNDKRSTYIAVKLNPKAPGLVDPVRVPTSGDFQRIADTDGMVEIPPGNSVSAPQYVHLYYW